MSLEDYWWLDESEVGDNYEINESLEAESVKDIDLDRNGKVTIKEAEEVGFKMPIGSSRLVLCQ